MSTYIKPSHYWEYCGHCRTKTVMCGTCGNNVCNSGYGEVMGREPGTVMPCPECPSAHALFTQWIDDKRSTQKV